MTYFDVQTVAQFLSAGGIENFNAAVGYLKTKTNKPLGEIDEYCRSLRGHSERVIVGMIASDFPTTMDIQQPKDDQVTQTDNPYFPKTRVAKIVIELETYGTEDQQQKSIEKFKREVALQGLKVTVCSVTLNNDQ